ncbi:MAG: hypothetical protein ABI165_05055 [Bryobacteraceae bacterium]
MRTLVLLLTAGALFAVEKPGPPVDPADQLMAVKRIYVDRLSGGPTAEQIRDMIITALEQTKLFVITENEDRADAFLRGSAEDLLYTDTFNSADSQNVHGAASTHSSSGETTGGAYDRWGYNRATGQSNSLGAGSSESSHIEERKHEAVASVRLVGKSGDVLWSSTEESLGAKFRGSRVDVADKIAKQLVTDYTRLIRGQAAQSLISPVPKSTRQAASAALSTSR